MHVPVMTYLTNSLSLHLFQKEINLMILTIRIIDMAMIIKGTMRRRMIKMMHVKYANTNVVW